MKTKKAVMWLTIISIMLLFCFASYAASAVPCTDGTHEFESEILTHSTEDTEGEVENTCIKCGYSYIEALPMTGHQWGAWMPVEDRGADGAVEERECMECHRMEQRFLPAQAPVSSTEEPTKETWKPNATDAVLTTSIGMTWIYVFFILWWNSLVLLWYKRECEKKRRERMKHDNEQLH